MTEQVPPKKENERPRPMSFGRCKACDCTGYVGAGADPFICARVACKHPIKDHD